MGNVQTNFRAEDMIGSRAAKAAKKGTKKTAAPAEEPKAQTPTESEVPTGSINEIKDWVGDDQARAQQALASENEREKPRVSLVEWLEGVGTETKDDK